MLKPCRNVCAMKPESSASNIFLDVHGKKREFSLFILSWILEWESANLDMHPSFAPLLIMALGRTNVFSTVQTTGVFICVFALHWPYEATKAWVSHSRFITRKPRLRKGVSYMSSCSSHFPHVSNKPRQKSREGRCFTCHHTASLMLKIA